MLPLLSKKIKKRSFKILIITQYSGEHARIWRVLIEIPLFHARIVPPTFTISFTRRHCITKLPLSWLKIVTFGLQCLWWNRNFPNSALLSMIYLDKHNVTIWVRRLSEFGQTFRSSHKAPRDSGNFYLQNYAVVFCVSFKLRQRGPYVYNVTSKRIDVKFESGKVTSKTFEQAKFKKTLTNEGCLTCGENDEVRF